MGNEMGNSNTSGLKEEDYKTVEALEKSFPEAAHADDVKGQNQVLPAVADKDFNEKITELPSDGPTGYGDPHVDDQTLGKEQEETEVHAPAEFPKDELKSNEAGGEDSEILSVSSSKDSEDHEKLLDSNLEESLLGTSDHPLEKQAPIKKEEGETKNSTYDAMSTPRDPETPEPADSKYNQHKLAEIHADPSVQDGCRSPQGSEDILESNLACDSEERGQSFDTDISNNLGENFVINTNNVVQSVVYDANPDVERKGDDLIEKEMASLEEKKSCEEKLQTKSGDEVGNVLSKITTITSDFPSGVENKCYTELPTEMNLIRNEFPESQVAAFPMAMSLNSHLEDSEPQDKCMVLTEETKLIGKESESEENKHHYNPTQLYEEAAKESKTDETNASQSENLLMVSDLENDEKVSIITTTCDAGSNKNSPTEETKDAENGCQVDACENSQNVASEASCKNSERKAAVVPELETVPADLTVTDSKRENEEPTEKKIVEVIQEKTESSYGVGKETKGKEDTAKECMPQPLPVAHAEAFLSESLVSLLQPQNYQQDTGTAPDTIQSSNESTSELKQASGTEFFVTEASTFNSMNLTADTLVSVVELATEKPWRVLSHYAAATPIVVAETKTSEYQSSEECAIKASALERGVYEAQGSLGRLSTESNPDNLEDYVQMRKSPSFNLDLRIEARAEESDRTPLLNPDRTASSPLADVSLGNPIAHTEYAQDRLQYEAMPVEHKVVKLERSDSEKSKTPFLGFLKDEEETHIAVTPQKQGNHAVAKKAAKELWSSPTREVISTSPKGKEKRKPRSSLFGNCMCCATVIN